MNALLSGTRVGPYTIEDILNTGVAGTVYRACDAAGTEVILKMPHLAVLGNPAVFERYQREATIGQRLHHDHVQHVIATGEHEGVPFLVLNYVAGESLRATLERQSPFTIPDALQMLDELCQGVASCHDQGIVHRDLKPENIILTATGTPVIIDFGIAYLAGARRITWAGLSATVGTPDYMAPEQIQGKRGDARSDVYALGAIGYELLSGQPPFQGDTPMAVMHQHLYGTVKPLTDVLPTIPATLDVVMRKALQRAPHDRFQSVIALQDALRHYTTVAATLSLAPTAQAPGHFWRRLRMFLVHVGR